MKKLLTAILVLTLVLSCSVAVFAGCQPPTDYERTIVFYTSQGQSLEPITAVAIQNFEAKYPGWKVQHIRAGGYDDVKERVTQDLGAGLQPDLAYCYPDHVAAYIETGKVVNMSKYLLSTETVTGVVPGTATKESEGTPHDYTIGFTQEELDDFVASYYDEGYARNYTGYADYGYKKDDVLTLPFVRSTELMFYNKTALDKCGLEPATTWDELWEQCEIITDRFPTCTPLGYDSEANWFITMCAQNGWGYTSADPANHYLFNNDNTRAWLEELHGYYEEGYITTQEEYGAYTSALFIQGVDKGGLVYCIGSSGGASHQSTEAFEWGITSVPVSEGETGDRVISQGPSLVMLTGGHEVTNADEKEKMTFLFIKELLEPTFQAEFSRSSGYNPVRHSVYDIDDYADFLEETDITAVAVKVASEMEERLFTSPAFNGSSLARTQVGNALLEALVGRTDAATALQTAYRNCGGK